MQVLEKDFTQCSTERKRLETENSELKEQCDALNARVTTSEITQERLTNDNRTLQREVDKLRDEIEDIASSSDLIDEFAREKDAREANHHRYVTRNECL